MTIHDLKVGLIYDVNCFKNCIYLGRSDKVLWFVFISERAEHFDLEYYNLRPTSVWLLKNINNTIYNTINIYHPNFSANIKYLNNKMVSYIDTDGNWWDDVICDFEPYIFLDLIESLKEYKVLSLSFYYNDNCRMTIDLN